MRIVLIIIMFVFYALCSFLEISFSGINVIRIKKMALKNKRAKMVYELTNKYSEVLTTILIVNCITGILLSSMTVCYFTDVYGNGCAGIVTVILTIIVLLFAEIFPKIIGREYSEEIQLFFVYFLTYLVEVFGPVNKIISKFEKRVKNKHKVTASRDELVEIVKTIEDEGVIEESESAFIQKAVLLKKLKVANVMINKDDVSYLYDTDSSYKVKKCIFKDNHDRIPIIDKDGKIKGILYEVDLLDEILDNGTISIKNSMKEAICISRSTNLASCLELLHGARAHMAVVTDRSDNFLGIVTIEDVINELMKV